MRHRLHVLVLLCLCAALFFALLTAALAAAQTPTYVQWATIATQNNTASSKWKIRLPNPSQAGNLLIMACSWSTSGATTLTIADDKSNTWHTGKSVDDGTNTESAAIFYAQNVAAGTSLITASWTAAVGNNMCWPAEVFNVNTGATPVDVTCGQVITSTAVACGSMTTTQANDLIVHFSFCDTCAAKVTYTAGSGFALRQVDDWSDAVLQTQVQSSAGAINPTVTASASNTYVSVGVAFKNASAGSDLPAGIHVRYTHVLNAPQNGTLSSSMTWQSPSFSNINLLALNWVDADVTNPPTSITSSPSNTFTNVTCAAVVATSTFEARWTYVPSPSTSSDMTITLAYASTPSLQTPNIVYGISGAATSPYDTCANANGNLNATSGTVTGPNLTPSTSNGLVIAMAQQSGDTVTAVPSPTGANMDNVDAGIYELISADSDGGYMNYLNPNTSAVQVNWTYSAYETPSTNVGPWGSQAVAFKAPAAGGGGGGGVNKRQKIEKTDNGLVADLDPLNLFTFQECAPDRFVPQQTAGARLP